MKSNPRREIEFTLDGNVIRSRPTMARVAEIESKFGPAPTLAGKCARLELSVMNEQLPMLAIMLRGAEGAPKDGKSIMEQAFEDGAAGFATPMTYWLLAAYSVDEPAETEKPDAGN